MSIYVICVCLCIVMSSTYCVVFLFCFSSSCQFLWIVPLLIAPSVFSNVYLRKQWKTLPCILTPTSTIYCKWMYINLHISVRKYFDLYIKIYALCDIFKNVNQRSDWLYIPERPQSLQDTNSSGISVFLFSVESPRQKSQ